MGEPLVSTIQTVFIFVGGYLISRLVLCADGHQVFVGWLSRRSGGRAGRMVLGVMAGAFLLSTIIPNALTVLALIPVVTALREGSREHAPAKFGTLLAMGLIYGGNIGGLASLVGSPANLYLLVNLRIYNVPGAASLHFVSWLIFGLPMAAIFVMICWSMLRLTESSTMGARVPVGRLAVSGGPMLPLALRWSMLWLAYWVGALVLVAATGVGAAPLWRAVVWGQELGVTAADLVGGGFTLLLIPALFLLPQRVGTERRPLMRPRDLLREVPVKGLIMGAAVLVILVIVARSGVVGYLERGVEAVLPEEVGALATVFVVVLITIFATEVLNNTTVSTVLFPLSVAIARRAAVDPLLLMLAVSLASTCAFMTPVATPVNALAFGGVGQVSLRTFVKNGLLTNVLAALWITLWIRWLIPHVLLLFR
jgi:solute carrier family 13 (sodium-dependent dicarboxylate transporter), member 2/3/5